MIYKLTHKHAAPETETQHAVRCTRHGIGNAEDERSASRRHLHGNDETKQFSVQKVIYINNFAAPIRHPRSLTKFEHSACSNRLKRMRMFQKYIEYTRYLYEICSLTLASPAMGHRRGTCSPDFQQFNFFFSYSCTNFDSNFVRLPLQTYMASCGSSLHYFVSFYVRQKVLCGFAPPRARSWRHHCSRRTRNTAGNRTGPTDGLTDCNVGRSVIMPIITSTNRRLSGCLLVCLLATLRKNFRTDLHKIFTEG